MQSTFHDDQTNMLSDTLSLNTDQASPLQHNINRESAFTEHELRQEMKKLFVAEELHAQMLSDHLFLKLYKIRLPEEGSYGERQVGASHFKVESLMQRFLVQEEV